MRFTFIATALMIGVTIGVTPGLRMDLKGRVLNGPATPHPRRKECIHVTHIGRVGQPHLSDSLAS